jgi:hypothetical protein
MVRQTFARRSSRKHECVKPRREGIPYIIAEIQKR